MTPVPTAPPLSEAERERYGRHLILPEVGEAGQQRLRRGRVLLVGAGGLGSPAALYLAAAGVGEIGLLDFDRVELSNLQRQVLFTTADVGRLKVEAAAERLRALNPLVEITPIAERLDEGNALDYCRAWDLVVDGSDNAATRYLVNDACVHLGKADVWGAVLQFEGQLAVFGLPGGPCYRCLFPEPPPPDAVPSCAEGGVLGVLPGIIGALQANEAIKLLLGRASSPGLVIFDALAPGFRQLALQKNPECPVCADPARVRIAPPAAACADRSLPMSVIPPQITVEELDSWRREGREHVLIDVREPQEHSTASIEGARLIPLRQLPEHLGELDPNAAIVVHCHHGGRSAQAVSYLRQRGFTGATNLTGGIDAWSQRVDRAVPRY